MAIVLPRDSGDRGPAVTSGYAPAVDRQGGIRGSRRRAQPVTPYTQKQARLWASRLTCTSLASRLTNIAGDPGIYHPENRKALIREAALRLRGASPD